MPKERILIYDIETEIFDDKINPKKDKLKFFGCYSYVTNKYYYLQSLEDIKKIINAHDFLVGFNIIQYDNQVLYYNGLQELIDKNNYDDCNFKYKINIDLMDVFKKRAGGMKIKKGMLGDLLMSYSLDYISKTIGIVDNNSGKIKDFDYSIFKKSIFTESEKRYIIDYLKRDLDVTKKMYEWLEDYFDSFKHFLNDEDIKNKKYLTCNTSVFAYKAICEKLNFKEEYSNKKTHKTYSGGYVSYPAGESFAGAIYCLDYNCLIEGTKINCLTKGNFGFKKRIEQIKINDKIRGVNGKVNYVDNINVYDYNDDVIEITLNNNNKIICTPNHKIPIYRDNEYLEVEAQNILSTDDLITSHTKRKDLNPNFKGLINKKCNVCGSLYSVYPSQTHIKACSTECSNILKTINSAKTNLGKTKYDTSYLMNMSKERKNKKRTQNICYNIANANRINNQIKKYGNGKYEYKGIYFKSQHEKAVAKAFDRDKIEWIYEPKVTKLQNGMVYTIDFYLPTLNKYVEVKGYQGIGYGKNAEKIKQFFRENKNSVLITPQQINSLKEVLKNGKD